MQVQPTTKVRISSKATKDNGKIGRNSLSPSMPAVRVAPANVAGADKVRVGAVSPSLPRSR
jgi:hypothetical protein